MAERYRAGKIPEFARKALEEKNAKKIRKLENHQLVKSVDEISISGERLIVREKPEHQQPFVEDEESAADRRRALIASLRAKRETAPPVEKPMIITSESSEVSYSESESESMSSSESSSSAPDIKTRPLFIPRQGRPSNDPTSLPGYVESEQLHAPLNIFPEEENSSIPRKEWAVPQPMKELEADESSLRALQDREFSRFLRLVGGHTQDSADLEPLNRVVRKPLFRPKTGPTEITVESETARANQNERIRVLTANYDKSMQSKMGRMRGLLKFI